MKNETKNKKEIKQKKSIMKKIKQSKFYKKLHKVTSKIDLSKNKFNALELILMFIMALVFGVLIGEMVFSNGKTVSSITYKTSKELAEVENVYNTLVEQYINKIDKETLKEAAIDGMFSALGDQHSAYYNEEDSEDYKEELNGYFYGMGAAVYQEEGSLVTVNEIYPNSPAEKAGLKKGDQYLKINGEDTTKLTATEISKKIKDTKGKEFTLTIKRNEEQVNLKVTTGKVEIPSVTTKIFEKDKTKIGYLNLSVFASNTDEQFKKKLEELEKQNINKLIIDLRYNQGGYTETVVNIASELLPHKTPIIQIVKEKETEIKYSHKKNEKQYEIVVLINVGSASASEVLAAALNEQLGSELIGETTFGKGTVQQSKTLPSGGIIKYTTETWKTSKGKDIDQKGIKPTIKVEQSDKYYETYSEKDDTQLQKAIEIIKK